MQRRRRRGFLRIDFVLFVRRLKQIGKPADRFRRAQKQESVWFERVMKSGHRLLLQTRLEIDQQVAATDQVHPREWRIADHILPREYDALAQWFDDAIAALLLDEKAAQPLRR